MCFSVGSVALYGAACSLCYLSAFYEVLVDDDDDYDDDDDEAERSNVC